MWSRYKRSSLADATEVHILDQLWACCSDALEQTIYRSGTAAETEVELLAAMKKMSVKKQNVLINVVEFLSMGQADGEPVKHYAARLKGAAATCNFTLPLGQQDYTENMVKHQLVRGINNPFILEQVLAQATTEKGIKMDLQETLNLIEAKESGKQDASLLGRTGAGSLNKSTQVHSELSPSIKQATGGRKGCCEWHRKVWLV